MINTNYSASTGPSLTKQLSLLKRDTRLCNNHKDASMPILEKWGIKPDIVTSIERVEETASFLKKLALEFQKRCSVCILSSATQEIYENIKDGQLVIAMRPFGYMQIPEFK